MMPTAKQIAEREAWANAHNPSRLRRQARLKRKAQAEKEARRDPTYGPAMRENGARRMREYQARKNQGAPQRSAGPERV